MINVSLSTRNRQGNLENIRFDKPFVDLTPDDIQAEIKGAEQISVFHTHVSEKDQAVAICGQLASMAEYRGAVKHSEVDNDNTDSVGLASASREPSRSWDGDALMTKLGITL